MLCTRTHTPPYTVTYRVTSRLLMLLSLVMQSFAGERAEQIKGESRALAVVNVESSLLRVLLQQSSSPASSSAAFRRPRRLSIMAVASDERRERISFQSSHSRESCRC